MEFDEHGIPGPDLWAAFDQATQRALDSNPATRVRPPLTAQNLAQEVRHEYDSRIAPALNDALRAAAATCVRFAAPRAVNMGHEDYGLVPLDTGMLVVGQPDIVLGGEFTGQATARLVRIWLRGSRFILPRQQEPLQKLEQLCNGDAEPAADRVAAVKDILGRLRHDYTVTVGTYLAGSRPELCDDMAVRRYREASLASKRSRLLRWALGPSSVLAMSNESALLAASHALGHPNVDVYIGPVTQFCDESDLSQSTAVTGIPIPTPPVVPSYRQGDETIAYDALLSGPRAQAGNARAVTELLRTAVLTPLCQFDFARSAAQ